EAPEVTEILDQIDLQGRELTRLLLSGDQRDGSPEGGDRAVVVAEPLQGAPAVDQQISLLSVAVRFQSLIDKVQGVSRAPLLDAQGGFQAEHTCFVEQPRIARRTF